MQMPGDFTALNAVSVELHRPGYAHNLEIFIAGSDALLRPCFPRLGQAQRRPPQAADAGDDVTRADPFPRDLWMV